MSRMSPAEIALLIEQLKNRVHALPGLRGDAQQRQAGEMPTDQRGDLLGFRGAQFIDAVKQDGVGFLELLAEDVRGLRGEASTAYFVRGSFACGSLSRILRPWLGLNRTA